MASRRHRLQQFNIRCLMSLIVPFLLVGGFFYSLLVMVIHHFYFKNRIRTIIIA